MVKKPSKINGLYREIHPLGLTWADKSLKSLDFLKEAPCASIAYNFYLQSYSLFSPQLFSSYSIV